MKHFLVFVYGIITCLATEAQTKFVDTWIYSNVSLSRDGRQDSLKAMVDTGCSFCVMDSAYAAEAWGISEADYIKGGKEKKQYFVLLDSLRFCGKAYPGVYCMITDVAGKFVDYAPRFIVGGNILIRGAWKFDLANNSVEACDIKRKPTGHVIHWVYSRKAVNSIMLKCKIDGRKQWLLFDTGSRHCNLPQGFITGTPEHVRKESADIAHRLQIVDAELTRGVHFRIGKQDFEHDFFNGKYNHGLLNAYSLGGTALVVNYKRQTLEIIP
ncbi:MAG: hypothetical protein IJ064_05165 [Bacteroidaceae bacterium]|nr:hypothetical protein [Bacteroidaceae bacterium]